MQHQKPAMTLNTDCRVPVGCLCVRVCVGIVAPHGVGITIAPWWEVQLMIDNHANGQIPSYHIRLQHHAVIYANL